jgi:pimeloyl-ACP methyl ester carboxylesterase
MDLDIRFCRTTDGARIAYATIGSGPPLVWPPGWISHLELEWEEPEYRAFFGALARHHRVVLYDRWGCGLSDRDRADFSLESDLRPLTAVIDALGTERVALMGGSGAGPIAIAYAVLNPERLTHLALYGTWRRRDPSEREFREAVTALVRAHWGFGPQTLADIFMPGAGPARQAQFVRMQREGATAEMAARLRDVSSELDVSEFVPRVTTPTLILHRRGDQIVPFERGRELAALIPGARFVPLEGESHNWTHGDTGALLRPLLAFLGDPAPDASAAPPAAASSALDAAGLSAREVEVLRLLTAGKSNPEIADELVISVHTVIRHANHIFAKLGVQNRVEAATYAQRHGLA